MTARQVNMTHTVRVPADLLQALDGYVARMEAELRLPMTRSDALRRLVQIGLEAEAASKPEKTE